MGRALALLLLVGGAARADMAAAAPVPERVGLADAVVVAKVTALEDKTAELRYSPFAKEKMAFRVAELEVSEQLSGSMPSKKFKLAYMPPGRRGTPFRIEKGKEGMLFLTRIHGTPYWRAASYYDVVGKERNPGFDAEATEARRAGKLLAHPLKALEGKDAADRQLAAALLVLRWRKVPQADEKERKEAEVPADLSKAVMLALAEGDWAKPEYSHLGPRSLFLRLPLTEKDGWKAKDLSKLDVEAKAWLKENAGKYRMKRWTAGDAVEP